MTERETQAWLKATTEDPGRWRVDALHNGCNGRSFLVYAPDATDPINGTYAQASKDGHWEVGFYQGAYPHIGEAMFMKATDGSAINMNAAITALVERFGAKFLIDLYTRATMVQVL